MTSIIEQNVEIRSQPKQQPVTDGEGLVSERDTVTGLTSCAVSALALYVFDAPFPTLTFPSAHPRRWWRWGWGRRSGRGSHGRFIRGCEDVVGLAFETLAIFPFSKVVRHSANDLYAPGLRKLSSYNKKFAFLYKFGKMFAVCILHPLDV